ncbi:hypothetical protein MNV49_000897 [Pseudohyphozyma bogoriensis]|nr:hypothetical protein MNV49_000897 [Pseudohyphozyma bogoriensis]
MPLRAETPTEYSARAACALPSMVLLTPFGNSGYCTLVGRSTMGGVMHLTAHCTAHARGLTCYDSSHNKPVAAKFQQHPPRYPETQQNIRANRIYENELRICERVHARKPRGSARIRAIRYDEFGSWIVMDWLDGYNLLEYTREHLSTWLSEETLEIVGAQLFKAVANLHSRGIVNGDIKPANVMLGYDNAVHMVDFQLGHLTDDTGYWLENPLQTKTSGAPPEVWEARINVPAMWMADDVWRAGVVMLNLIASGIWGLLRDICQNNWDRRPSAAAAAQRFQ